MNETAELLGLSLRMTEDQITKDMLLSSASAYNCVFGYNGDLPTNITLTDIDNVATTLSSNDAWMILDSQQGELRFGTAPIRNAFVALGHTKLQSDLNALNGFVSQWNYPNQQNTMRSEWGTVNNVRFMLSSVGPVTQNASLLGNDVYSFFFLGMESYSTIAQDNFSSQFLYRPPVFSDPLFQNVTLGCVFAQANRILNDLWITNVRCTLA